MAGDGSPGWSGPTCSYLGKMHVQQGTNSHGGTSMSHLSKITSPLVALMYGMVPHTCLPLMLGLYNAFGKSTV